MYMYLVVLKKLKDTMRSTHFIAVSCDEVMLCDSGFPCMLMLSLTRSTFLFCCIFLRLKVKGLMC